MKNSLTAYSIPSDLAKKCESIGLPVSTIKGVPQKDLIAKYGLSKDEARVVKHAVERKPIDPSVARSVLHKSNYCCCLCKDSQHGYIIHHIVEYSVSQDNSESNLAVLCPNHHNSAHKTGPSLTETIDKRDIQEAKWKWEEEVKKANQIKAMSQFRVDVGNVDYCNFKRLEEACIRLFDEVPNTKYSARLFSLRVLNASNQYDTTRFDANKDKKRNYFDKINEGEGLHFVELIKCIGQKVAFTDLSKDSSLAIAKTLKIGDYVMLTKKMRGKMFQLTTIDAPKTTIIRNKKRKTVIELAIDSNYMFSTSANERLGRNNLYVTYGIFLGTEKFTDYKEDDLAKIKISPFIIAFPYIEDSEEFDNEYANFDMAESLKDAINGLIA